METGEEQTKDCINLRLDTNRMMNEEKRMQKACEEENKKKNEKKDERPVAVPRVTPPPYIRNRFTSRKTQLEKINKTKAAADKMGNGNSNKLPTNNASSSSTVSSSKIISSTCLANSSTVSKRNSFDTDDKSPSLQRLFMPHEPGEPSTADFQSADDEGSLLFGEQQTPQKVDEIFNVSTCYCSHDGTTYQCELCCSSIKDHDYLANRVDKFYPHARKDTQNSDKNLCLQLNKTQRQFSASLKKNSEIEFEILRIKNENHSLTDKISKLETERTQHLNLISSLKEKLRTCALLAKSLRCELDNNAENKAVRGIVLPFQSLNKKRQIERLKPVLACIESVIGPQSSPEQDHEAKELVLKELASALNVEIGMRKLSAYEDMQVFFKNGVTWNQRSSIKKVLIEYDMDFLAPSNSVFKWKTEFASDYEKLYTKKKVEINGKFIPLVFLNDVRTLLEKRLKLLKNSNKLKFDKDFGGKIWLSVIADKGSSFTKTILQIANSDSPNSLKNSLILAVYQGDENHETLKKCLDEVTHQVDSLNTVQVESDTFGVEMHLTGDMKTMVTMSGIQSCNSLFFCIFCTFQVSGSGKWCTGQAGAARTLQNIIEAASKFASMKFSSINARNRAIRKFFSVVNFPLFKILIENFVPSALHIFLGIGNMLIELLEKEVIIFELSLIGIEIAASKQKNWQDKVVESTTSELKSLRKLEERILAESNTLSSLQQIHSTLAFPPKKKTKKETAQKCQSQRCSYIDSEPFVGIELPKPKNLVCMTCNKWFHTLCQLYVSDEHVAEVRKKGFVCDICQAPTSSFQNRLLKKIDENEAEKITVRARVVQTSVVLEQIDNIITKKNGETYKELQNKFCKIGAWKNAWYKTYNGNQLRSLFSGNSIQNIFSVFQLPMNRKLSNIRRLMELLQDIQSHACSRFLNDLEIQFLKQSIESYVLLFTETFPEIETTPKMHWLGTHLIDFVERKKTWGLLSEQVIERLHSEWNRAEKRFLGVRDIEDKMARNALDFIQISNNSNISIQVNINTSQMYGPRAKKSSRSKNKSWRRKQNAKKSEKTKK